MDSFDFLFGLCLEERTLCHTDNLSKTLQLPEISAADSQRLAAASIATLQKMRTDASYQLFWQSTCDLRAQMKLPEPKLPRRRKPPTRFQIGSRKVSHPATVQVLYRAQYFLALDTAMACIRERFDQPGYQTYKRLG